MDYIEKYIKSGESIRDQLEAQYNIQMYMGDVEKAYQIFLKLMEFGFISADDKRANPSTKLFRNSEVCIKCNEPANWAGLDIRRNNGAYVPKYFLCNCAYKLTSPVIQVEHWGKRVEGNYSGDVMIGNIPKKLICSSVNYIKQIDNLFDNLQNVEKEYKLKAGSFESMRKAAKVGAVRVYEVTVDGNTLPGLKTIGYLFMRYNYQTSQFDILVSTLYNVAIKSWIDVDMLNQAMDGFAKALIEADGLDSDDISIRHLFKKDEASKKFKSILATNLAYKPKTDDGNTTESGNNE